MCRQCGLDLLGIDVEATADDHLLRAAHQRDQPASVLACQVSRPQPALAYRPGGFLGHVPVALHHMLRANRELPRLTHGNRCPVGGTDDDFDHRVGPPDAPDAKLACAVIGTGCEVVARCQRRHGHHRFGQAEVLRQDRAEPLQGLFQGVFWYRLRAVSNRPQRGQVMAVNIRVVHQPCQECRNAGEDRYPLLLDAAQQVVHRACGDQHTAGAPQEPGHEIGAARMGERSDMRQRVIVPDIPVDQHVPAHGEPVPVAQHDTLGPTRRTRGVVDRTQILQLCAIQNFGRQGGLQQAGPARSMHRILAVDLGHPETGKLRGSFLRTGAGGAVVEEHRGIAVAQRRADIRGCRARIDGDTHHCGALHRHLEQQALRAVGKKNRDPCPRRQARRQPTGDPVAEVTELPVRPTPVPVHQAGARGKAPRRLPHECAECRSLVHAACPGMVWRR